MLKPGLVRFLLSSLVIFYHLSGAVFIGTMAVYCFFMLSGYWVSFMYEAKYLKSDSPVKLFYLSRMLRIFPAYLLIAIFSFIALTLWYPNFTEILSSITGGKRIIFYLSNVFIIGYNQLGFKPIVPAWSLDVELQFYIALPFLYLLAKKRGTRILFFCLFSAVTIVLSVWYPESLLFKTVLNFLTYFFIGIIMYKEKIQFSKKIEVLFNALVILILISHFALHSTAFYTLIRLSANYELYFNEIISLFTIPLLFNSVTRKSDNLDRILGDVSYVLYLLHWVLIIPYNHFTSALSKSHRLPVAAAYLILTYLLAYLLFIVYDKPIDRLRRAWLTKKYNVS